MRDNVEYFHPSPAADISWRQLVNSLLVRGGESPNEDAVQKGVLLAAAAVVIAEALRDVDGGEVILEGELEGRREDVEAVVERALEDPRVNSLFFTIAIDLMLDQAVYRTPFGRFARGLGQSREMLKTMIEERNFAVPLVVLARYGEFVRENLFSTLIRVEVLMKDLAAVPRRSKGLDVKTIAEAAERALGWEPKRASSLDELISEDVAMIFPDDGDEKIWREWVDTLPPEDAAKLAGKKPDCLLKVGSRFFVVEMKSFKDMGGGVEEILKSDVLKRLKTDIDGVHFVAIFDSGLAMKMFGRGKRRPVVFSKLMQALREHKNNYAVTVAGFVELLQDAYEDEFGGALEGAAGAAHAMN